MATFQVRPVTLSCTQGWVPALGLTGWPLALRAVKSNAATPPPVLGGNWPAAWAASRP